MIPKAPKIAKKNSQTPAFSGPGLAVCAGRLQLISRVGTRPRRWLVLKFYVFVHFVKVMYPRKKILRDSENPKSHHPGKQCFQNCTTASRMFLTTFGPKRGNTQNTETFRQCRSTKRVFQWFHYCVKDLIITTNVALELLYTTAKFSKRHLFVDGPPWSGAGVGVGMLMGCWGLPFLKTQKLQNSNFMFFDRY